jgi:hypothetical protein
MGSSEMILRLPSRHACRPMLNRSALIVRPGKPFLDWARSLNDSGLLPDVDGEQHVYLVPVISNEHDERRVLQGVYAEVFASELYDWDTDESRWPRGRDLAMFQTWFKIEIHSVVLDLCSYEITEEEF